MMASAGVAVRDAFAEVVAGDGGASAEDFGDEGCDVLEAFLTDGRINSAIWNEKRINY
jgi:hypothetical protein